MSSLASSVLQGAVRVQMCGVELGDEAPYLWIVEI